MLFEKGMHFKLKEHHDIYGITVLDVGFKCAIVKIEYQDGMVCERKFHSIDLSELLMEY